MIEVYQILHTIYDNEVSPKLAMYNARVTIIRNRGHTLKLFAQRAQQNIRKHALSLRVTTAWDSLHPSVINATN